MTRDEAIKILSDNIPVMRGTYGAFLDSFVALGMLKLDEPRDAEKEFFEILNCYVQSMTVRDTIWRDMTRAGLKIVKK